MRVKKFKKMRTLVVVSFILSAIMGTTQTFAASGDTLKGKGNIQFKKNDFPTPPVDPQNPDKPVVFPEPPVATEGELRLDFVPKFTFGSFPISQKDETYHPYAQMFSDETPARPNYIQVTDNRGTLAGWELSVKQETQFSNSEAKNKELNGAVLSLDKQWANSTFDSSNAPNLMKDTISISQMGVPYPLAKAQVGKGMGTWTIAFGYADDQDHEKNTLEPVVNADGKPLLDAKYGNKPLYRNTAISLFVPGKTEKDPTQYTTVLTWTLSELP